MLNLMCAMLLLGVCHGDELFQLFANRLLPGPVNEDDKKVSKMLIDLWTSFAIDGYHLSTVACWNCNEVFLCPSALQNSTKRFGSGMGCNGQR